MGQPALFSRVHVSSPPLLSHYVQHLSYFFPSRPAPLLFLWGRWTNPPSPLARKLSLSRDHGLYLVEASVDRRGFGLLVRSDRAQFEVAELRRVAYFTVQPVCHGLGALRASLPTMATFTFEPKAHAATIARFRHRSLWHFQCSP